MEIEKIAFHSLVLCVSFSYSTVVVFACHTDHVLLLHGGSRIANETLGKQQEEEKEANEDAASSWVVRCMLIAFNDSRGRRRVKLQLPKGDGERQ